MWVIASLCPTIGSQPESTEKRMLPTESKTWSKIEAMSKSGRKKVSFQDMEHEVSKAPSFKTTEETNNKLISFKTFDNWIKARTANCDMALKDAFSFISDKKSAIGGEKDS